MVARSLRRWTVLAVAVGLAACASSQATTAGDTTSAAGEDHLLTVRTEYTGQVRIDLVGEGVRRAIGTVENQQMRTFRLPAHLMGPTRPVTIEAQPADGSAAFISKVFSLEPGDAVELKIDQPINMSTLVIKKRSNR